MPTVASQQDGSYPRPQLVRPHWTDLSGEWQFGYDDERAGVDERWQGLVDVGDRGPFTLDITVPYPPESVASGIGETGPHPVLWYRRALPLDQVADLHLVREARHRLVLRFGAVDHAARVWLDGQYVGGHEGGQTPWSVDLTEVLDLRALDRAGSGDRAYEPTLVVRAEDDPRDVTQPRGKQDWRDEPHAIWYHRTSGIWQPAWLEVLPPLALERLTWTPDVAAGTVRLALDLTAEPRQPVSLTVRLQAHGERLTSHTVEVTERRSTTTITIAELQHGADKQRYHWSPDSPTLVDADVRLLDGERELDAAASYLGLRSVGTRAGAFVLNGLPCFVRSALAQNYWPDSHLAASADELRREVELVKELGLNAVRIHQKVEDPRFLYWCDRLGVLVWGETANAFAFSPEAVRRLATEWMDIVARDAGHPCVVTWVPLNESWGVADIATDPAQQAYADALADLTRALDPSRPVVTNDGWEHTDSDLMTIHDYSSTGAELTAHFGTREAIDAQLAGLGAANGRQLRVRDAAERGQPVLLSEFGGIRYTPGTEADSESTWGYQTVHDDEAYESRLAELVGAALAAEPLAGFCYTQLTDTVQEANGLLDEQRRPKIPVERIRAIFAGPRRRPG